MFRNKPSQRDISWLAATIVIGIRLVRLAWNSTNESQPDTIQRVEEFINTTIETAPED